MLCSDFFMKRFNAERFYENLPESLIGKLFKQENIRNLHNLLNEELKEKYNIPLSGFDGDKFRFHSTLFQDININDSHQEVIDKLNKEFKYPITININKIDIGISKEGKVGTFDVIDSIILK